MLKGGKNPNKQNTKALPYLQMQWEQASSVPAVENQLCDLPRQHLCLATPGNGLLCWKNQQKNNGLLKCYWQLMLTGVG